MQKLLSALLAALLSFAPILPAFPAQTPIGVGTTANDHSGDTPYVYTRKINQNFADLMGRVAVTPVVSCGGDSTCATGSGSVPPGSANATLYGAGTAANSYVGWLQAITNNGALVDLVNSGYPGSPGGLIKVKPATPGACAPGATLTFTPGAPTGTPANTAGTFTVLVKSDGTVDTTTWINLSNPGSGYTGQPGYTVSSTGAACTTTPTFNYALSGAGDWGVPGDTTDGLLARVPDICTSAVKPTWLFMPIGTNDVAGLRSFASITSNIAATVTALQACGVRPILFGITPRTIGSGGFTAAMDQVRLQVNRWEEAYSQQSASTGYLAVPYVDVDHLETDPSLLGGTIGGPLPNITYDGLHPAMTGAFYGGLMLANILRPYISPNIFWPNSQSDVYNASTAPGGNLIGTMGLMMGTTGSVGSNTGGVCTGQVATNWQILYSGTGTITCTSAIETARTDGLPGRRQVITYSNSGGGTAEKLTFAEFNNVAGSLTKGTDKIYATAKVDISGYANIQYAGCQLLESGAPVQQSSTTLLSGNIGPTLTFPTSSQIALLQEAKILPDFGLSGAGSFAIPCRTPVITTQSAATSYSFSIVVVGTSATTAETITVKVGDVAIRKVTP